MVGFRITRKLIPLAISVALVTTAISSPAFAAVKAGASCPKAGKTSVSSGKTFTCIKSGKKLVWNKGVAVAKPAVAPTPTPSATSEPTVTKTPAFPTSFTDLEEKFEGIPYSSWEKMNANLVKYPSSSLDISIQYGPNTPERYSTQITKDAVIRGARAMGGVKQPAAVKFYQFNKVDVEWGKEQAAKYQPAFNLGMSLPVQAADLCSRDDCDGGVTNLANGIGLVLVGVSTPANRYGDLARFKGQNDLHEYVHAVQGSVVAGKTKTTPPVLMPCWYSEGQPHAISIVATAKTSADYITARNSWMKDYKWLLNDFEPSTIEDFLKKNMKVPCPSSTNFLNYTVGFIVIDALIAIGGIEKTFEVPSLIADGMSFESAFEKVYETPWSNASPILSKVISKAFQSARK
ncbi:MAG: hypothetical protein RLY76_921 [Actinomycetota bacterium]